MSPFWAIVVFFVAIICVLLVNVGSISSQI